MIARMSIWGKMLMIMRELGEVEESFNRSGFRRIVQGQRCREHPASSSLMR